MDILFLEDDALLAESVIEELEEHGFSIDWVADGDAAADAAYERRYRLYLFDVNVPGMNGFSLLESLRDAGDLTPAIFLTSRNELRDLQQGFGSGADDYVKKPFDIDELVVRILAKLPKSGSQKLSESFSIDPENLHIVCRGEVQTLAAKEFAILHFLIQHKEQLVSAEDIIAALYEEPISIATFRVYIKNLKRHIGPCAAIENVKGVGYRFKTL